MKTFSMRSVALATVASACLSMAMPAVSYAAPKDGGVRTTLMSGDDAITSESFVATTAPAAGQTSITVAETVHYLHSPWIGRNTAYTLNRSGTAAYVDKLGYFVMQDPEGHWWQFQPGSAVGVLLSGKPQVDLGSQTHAIGQQRFGLSGHRWRQCRQCRTAVQRHLQIQARRAALRQQLFAHGSGRRHAGAPTRTPISPGSAAACGSSTPATAPSTSSATSPPSIAACNPGSSRAATAPAAARLT